jgi:hypothetical protein
MATLAMRDLLSRSGVTFLEDGAQAIRRRLWRVYGAAIQNAVGDRLSASETHTLDALLGAFIERWPTRWRSRDDINGSCSCRFASREAQARQEELTVLGFAPVSGGRHHLGS